MPRKFLIVECPGNGLPEASVLTDSANILSHEAASSRTKRPVLVPDPLRSSHVHSAYYDGEPVGTRSRGGFARPSADPKP
jgi:hypothetical protein